MSDSLFTYGKPAKGTSFTDREKECGQLVDNFKYGINTFLISPRRWGKTSLVLKAMNEAGSAELLTVFVDVFKCKSPSEFCQKVASAVLSQTSGKIEEAAGYVRDFLSRVTLGMNLSPDSASGNFSFSIALSEERLDLEEKLNLPQKIAQRKNVRILVCIDEFQQIGEFDDTLSFQKLLRTVWQHQTNVTYCLFGSKKHMMEKLMDSEDKPFYKFGDTIYLKRIPLEYWTPYIAGKFAEGGKSISDEMCKMICEKVDYNSYYVQQLSWFVFRSCTSEATLDALDDGVDEMIAQNSALFEARTEHLTAYQMNYLRAVSSGVHEGLTSSRNISRFKLGSSANCAVLKQALIEKDLIVVEDRKVYLTDPAMALWLLSED